MPVRSWSAPFFENDDGGWKIRGWRKAFRPRLRPQSSILYSFLIAFIPPPLCQPRSDRLHFRPLSSEAIFSHWALEHNPLRIHGQSTCNRQTPQGGPQHPQDHQDDADDRDGEVPEVAQARRRAPSPTRRRCASWCASWPPASANVEHPLLRRPERRSDRTNTIALVVHHQQPRAGRGVQRQRAPRVNGLHPPAGGGREDDRPLRRRQEGRQLLQLPEAADRAAVEVAGHAAVRRRRAAGRSVHRRVRRRRRSTRFTSRT